MSLRRKLTMALWLNAGLATLLLCLALIAVQSHQFRAQINERLTAVGDVAGANSAAAILFDDAKNAAQTLGALSTNRTVMAAGLYRKDGTLLAEYDRTRGDGFAPPKAAPPVGTQDSGAVFSVTRPVLLDGEVVGVICVVSGLQELYQDLLSYVAITVVTLVACTGLGMLVFLRLMRLLLVPI